MKQQPINRRWILSCIIIILISACTPSQEPVEAGDQHIVAHPQYAQGDVIDCLNWEGGTALTLEIDDPAFGSGVDFTATAVSQPLEEGGTTAHFDLGREWDLQPGHIITVRDKQASYQHIVRDISITGTDFESDLITGTADPGSEVMVWIEFPYAHELNVTVGANGEWRADFTSVTDIIPATVGAAAQNDDPETLSHTRVNFTFGTLHLEASLSYDVIGFNNFTPFNSFSFQIYDGIGGELIGGGSMVTNEIGYATFDNEDHAIDLQPGTFITAHDDASGRDVSLEMGLLSIETVDDTLSSISGQAKSGAEVHVNIYDIATEAEYVQQATAGEDGNWSIQFDVEFTEDMDVAARVFDEEGDETAFHWIRE